MVIVLLPLGPLNANTENEMENLAKLHKEIGLIIDLTKEYQRASEYKLDDRVRFRYDATISRLESLQGDIGKHIKWVLDNPKWERIAID